MVLNFENLIGINKNEVLRYLEYKGQDISDNLKNTIDECIEITKDKINPRYILRVYPISRENQNLNDNEIVIEGSNLKLKSKDLHNLLYDCNECIVMSATLGIDIEKEIRKYSYLELTKSVIIDACATTAIEELCDLIQVKIEEDLKRQGKYITMRYSPGYGDLPLDLNKEIINLLKSQKEIGLTITESDIMIPRKSVVAIIGITSNKVNKDKKSCLNCLNYKDCRYKKGDEHNGCKGIHKK